MGIPSVCGESRLSITRTSSGGNNVRSNGAPSWMLRRIIHAISILIDEIRVRGSCKSVSIAPASSGASLPIAVDRSSKLASQPSVFGEATSTVVV